MNTNKSLKLPDDSLTVKLESLSSLEFENNSRKIVLLITGLSMGSCDDNVPANSSESFVTDLGTDLMLDFLNNLPLQEILPNSIIFYNSGVKLACDNSPVISTLEFLQAQEIKLLVCNKSLDYFQLQDSLQIGIPASIHEISNCLFTADLIVRP